MYAKDPEAILVRYFELAQDALLWKLEGLSEYDLRRPLTPTGTNLLGIVKHVAWTQLGYFGDTFGRPHGVPRAPSSRTDGAPGSICSRRASESGADRVRIGALNRLGAFAIP